MPALQDLLGPFGLTVFLAFVAFALWREHLKDDQAADARYDRLVAIVEGFVPAVGRLAAAQEEANRDATQRHRRTD
jgi:hypothetical protein